MTDTNVPGTQTVSIADALAHAVTAHRTGRLDEAEAVYRAVIAAQPGHAEALRLLGVLAAQRNRVGEAITLLLRAVASAPQSAPAWTQLAELQKATGRFGDAIASASRALDLAPGTPKLLHLRAGAALDAGRFDEALADLDALLARAPGDAVALYNRGLALQSQRRYDAALASYEQALTVRPDLVEALHNKGNVLRAQGRLAAALASYDLALELRPGFAVAHSNRAGVLRELRRYDDALADCDRALMLAPALADAWTMRAAVRNDQGRHADALGDAEQALARNPALVAAHVNRAKALAGLGRKEEALAACAAALPLAEGDATAQIGLGSVLLAQGDAQRALACFDVASEREPANATAWWQRGLALHELQRLPEAQASLDRAVALTPDVAELRHLRAMVRKDAGRIDDALADWDAAVALDPGFADAHRFRGSALATLGRFDDAIASYDRAIALVPGLVEAWHNRGSALSSLRRFDEALASTERALELRPLYAEAWHNRGSTLSAMHRYDDAVASYGRALALKPDLIESLQNRGSVLMFLARYAEACRDFEAALALDGSRWFLRTMLLLARMHCCDWREHDARVAQIVAAVEGGSADVEPFAFLLFAGSPAAQLACARAWTQRMCPPAAEPLWRGERYAHERIRVAYLSADFHEHATAYLLAEVLEHHDRTRFEVVGVSYGPQADDSMRRRLVQACDRFVDVYDKRNDEVAALLRAQEIDIAVDLKGYTFEGRSEILAHRCAPVQVSWLGYPGTLGASYVDYVVADATVIPEASRQWYAEQVVWLPDSYQPNDRQRPIAAETPSRVAVGLPESGVVFCSFNNNYKITPAMFEVWMRLLRRVEGSVLWLLEGNAAAPANLRREAEARGVQAERLVFAPRMDLSQHLARHRLADVFLDTLPCNAHTTASDALWAGLPVVTCAGEAFAGRVAASLLRAAGLPELVTATLAEYEELAYELATQPERLAAVKAKLAAQRESCALFDSARFARHLESAYATMHARAQRGEPPAAFAVGAASPAAQPERTDVL